MRKFSKEDIELIQLKIKQNKNKNKEFKYHKEFSYEFLKEAFSRASKKLFDKK